MSALSSNFTARFLEKEGGMVRLITAEEEGRNAWFVLQLDTHCYSEYKTAMRTDDMNIRDYGTILKSGWGEPPADIVQQYAGG